MKSNHKNIEIKLLLKKMSKKMFITKTLIYNNKLKEIK
jgi:hypothetical protein